jgi:hypothetical protein
MPNTLARTRGGEEVQVRPGLGVLLSACIGFAIGLALVVSVWVDITVLDWAQGQPQWVGVLSRAATLCVAAGAAFACAHLASRLNPDPSVSLMAAVLVALSALGWLTTVPEAPTQVSANVFVVVFGSTTYNLQAREERVRRLANKEIERTASGRIDL